MRFSDAEGLDDLDEEHKAQLDSMAMFGSPLRVPKTRPADTVTITISREDAESLSFDNPWHVSPDVSAACRAALKETE